VEFINLDRGVTPNAETSINQDIVDLTIHGNPARRAHNTPACERPETGP